MKGIQMITAIPFAGFYESVFSAELDNVEEQNAEYMAEENPKIHAKDYAEIFYYCMDYGAAFRQIAAEYAVAFNEYIKDEFDLDLDLKFEGLESPKEYNFTTDRIFCHISDEAILKLHAAVPEEVMAAEVKARFTSRDGFISFYNGDYTRWDKDPTTWDHNELSTLLEALLHDDSDYTFRIYERLSEDCVFDKAFDSCMDWVKFEDRKMEFLEEEEVK